MPTYISMLRGINVSGQKKVLMEDLRKLYELLGLKDVTTYIQSGNVVFTHPSTNALELGSKIEKRIQQAFGFPVTVIMRTKEEFEKIIKNNPLVRKEDPKSLYVTFLSKVPVTTPMNDIEKAAQKSEKFVIANKEIYLSCPKGYGKTKLSNMFFERKLNVSATTRNWNTVLTLNTIAKDI